MFFKIGVYKNLAIFTGKHQLVGLKKETPTLIFSSEYCEIFKKIFVYRTPLVAASGY